MTTNGNVSFWYSEMGVPEQRPALSGAVSADVCIVGGGFTGLWSAYYLKRARSVPARWSSLSSVSPVTERPVETVDGCSAGSLGHDIAISRRMGGRPCWRYSAT